MSSSRKSKASTNNPADEHAAEAAQRQAEHDQAKALHLKREEALAAAEESLRLKQEAAVADDTMPAADLLTAEAEVRLARQRVEQSVALVQQAERGLLNTSTDLAEALAPLVAEVLGVVPTCQPFTPPSPVPVQGEPVAVLVQRNPAKLDRSGCLSGEVDVLLHRKRYHREMEAGEFHRHAERTGSARLAAYSGATQEQDGTYVDTVRLHVSGVLPEVPTVARGREDRGLTNLRADVVQRIAKRSTYAHSGPLSGGDSGKRQGVAVDSTARVIADNTRAGMRTVTVEASFTGSPTVVGSSWDLPTIRGEVELAALSLDGQAVADLGRVRSVKVVDAVVVQGAGVARQSGGTVMLGSPGRGTPVDGIAVRVRFVVIQRAAEGEERTAVQVPAQREERTLDAESLADREQGARTHPGVRE